MIYLAIIFSSMSLVLKTQVGPSGVVWMVPNVGKLVLCWEDSWFCGGGGGGLFGSVFGWTAWVLAAGYVICRGVKG
jgi:hypothetical protein